MDKHLFVEDDILAKKSIKKDYSIEILRVQIKQIRSKLNDMVTVLNDLEKKK